MQQQDQSSTKLHFFANRVLLGESGPESSSLALALQFLDYPLFVLRPRLEAGSTTAAAADDVLPIHSAKSCVLKPEDAQEAVQLVDKV
jgi:hypothetical protein